VQPSQPARVEAGEAWVAGLDQRSGRLQPAQDALPRVGGADRIGGYEGQARAARERFAQAHPRMDPERLGRCRDLPHELLAPRLGRQRRRLLHQPRARTYGDGELESRQKYADDRRHEHMFASLTTAINPRATSGSPHGRARDRSAERKRQTTSAAT
jgi:hypothetical protein